MAVYTHMKAMATQKDCDKRLEFKKYIARALYKAKFDSQTIRELFRFLDWIMTLPEEYECAYIDAIDELEEKMRYVTTFERRGIAKGLEKGIEQGIENLVIKAALAESLVEFSEYLATFARETTNKPDVKKVSEPAAAYKASKKDKKAPTRHKGGYSA